MENTILKTIKVIKNVEKALKVLAKEYNCGATVGYVGIGCGEFTAYGVSHTITFSVNATDNIRTIRAKFAEHADALAFPDYL